MPETKRINMLSRAQGCLMGQLAGDSLGSQVEFMSPDEIKRHYPEGVRVLADSKIWNTIAGQPTDDSEMALMLARLLAGKGSYNPAEALKAYIFWLDSDPFDCGATIEAGLRGRLNHDSQANGALMRISPLGIFGANHPLESVAEWAEQDAELTHPNPVCVQANKLFAMAVALAVKTGPEPQALYKYITGQAEKMVVRPSLMDVILGAAEAPPDNYVKSQGWVLIAFRNALWQLLNAPNLEEGVIDTVMRGGDTDTNAAICGALLGAVHGLEAVPDQWVGRILGCRPQAGAPGVRRPRPECFWPADALDLAALLIS